VQARRSTLPIEHLLRLEKLLANTLLFSLAVSIVAIPAQLDSRSNPGPIAVPLGGKKKQGNS
jgi:hypothetical protein